MPVTTPINAPCRENIPVSGVHSSDDTNQRRVSGEQCQENMPVSGEYSNVRRVFQCRESIPLSGEYSSVGRTFQCQENIPVSGEYSSSRGQGALHQAYLPSPRPSFPTARNLPCLRFPHAVAVSPHLPGILRGL
eukprot:839711-Prorocentrum_minimum.AAC.2